MYLKSIEVQGFKSFANKIDFQFHNGITAIVGPNGSGKSNVADAVRWVLGEQRIKQLRGSSMQDVIFSGTEARKPMGYAYVAITLDNSDHQLPVDFEEVTVSRRVYRSGESEYMINGVACRLKDVYEMFYDTGIGKEGYSIIGQGQIDKILSGKPEERRELFDEAAGIVKFKRRKDTTIKKLEDERANLVRVSDVLAELEKQIGPLERQSEIAKDFLKKRDELKRLDVNIFLLESEKSKKQLGELDEKLAIAQHDLNETTVQSEAIKVEYDQLEARIAQLDEEIGQKRKEQSDNSLLREKLESEIKVLEEKINSDQISGKHYSERKESLDSDIQRKEKEKEALLFKKSSMDAEAEEVAAKKAEITDKIEDLHKKIDELTNGVESDQSNIIKTLNDRALIQAKLGQFKSMLEQQQIYQAELSSKLLQAKSEEKEQDIILLSLTTELNDVSSRIMKTDQEIETLEESLSEFRKTLESADKDLGSAQVTYHEMKSRLDTLKNIAERYDGYGSSIRRVMEQKDHNKGIIGVVADILTVDKKYETAVETALGGNIQNIVTQDEAVAKKMIAFLKENKCGRATFLPLTSMRDRTDSPKEQVQDAKGFIGMASDLVSVDKKYDGVISQLLGAIIVMDHVDHALELAKKFNYTLRIVTLEGEYLTPGGALSGGSFKNSSNLLGRKREIEQLEEEVKESLKKIEGIISLIEDTKNKRNDVRAHIEELKNSQQDMYLQQNTAQMNVDAANRKKEELAEDNAKLENDLLMSQQQAKELDASRESAKKELGDSQEYVKKLEEQVRKFGEQLDALRDEESGLVLQGADIDLEYSKIKQNQDFAQENVNRVVSEIEKLSGEMAEVDKNLSDLAEEIERKQTNIKEIRITIDLSTTNKDETDAYLTQLITEREEAAGKQKTFIARVEEISNASANLDKEVYRLTSQKERTEEAIEGRINYMWNEYEITLSAAAELRDETLTDIVVIRRDIGELKDKIRRLGDVNVNAIEDYRVLMERYTFLKTQHDDLVSAEAALVNIINELDEKMRQLFIEKFAEIGKEFDKVFKELFGGGSGTLKLLEEEDILEAGINIIAQPPGKKLQNMMQLSGGEKALTAIALLFAIQNLKPSPFCLLDEIEAALDESNVGRFAGYLNKLTKHTQFIVITHRRGTMEKADRLYGITMQEKGVSALVSVNLIDKDLDD